MKSAKKTYSNAISSASSSAISSASSYSGTTKLSNLTDEYYYSISPSIGEKDIYTNKQDDNVSTQIDDNNQIVSVECKINNVFSCENCNKTFNSKAHLNQHLKKKYKCTKPINLIDNIDLSIIDKNEYKQIIEINSNLKKKIFFLEKDNVCLKHKIDNILSIINDTF